MRQGLPVERPAEAAEVTAEALAVTTSPPSTEERSRTALLMDESSSRLYIFAVGQLVSRSFLIS